ncbi:MAG: hypothetical protein V4496_00790 [Pseudomonadota bacterium]
MSPSPIVWVSFDQVIVTETKVPCAFTEDDILHYVLIEQAQLFPTLDQEIYFDFLVKNVDEDNKKIVIAACNKKNFLDLDSSTLFLKIEDQSFSALNLLPWRQRNKKLAHKRQLKILAIVIVGTSILMLLLSLCFIHQKHQDKKRAIDLSYRKKVIIAQLSALEKSNQEVQTLIDLWGNEISNARHSLNLEAALKTVEFQRPENLMLDKITWKENKLLIKGRSKTSSAIKIYLKNLSENAMNAQLKFIGNAINQEFSIQFEIEIRDKEK